MTIARQIADRGHALTFGDITPTALAWTQQAFTDTVGCALAVLMAQRGFTARPGAFEHKQGLLDVFNGPGTDDVDKMLADWYAPLECGGAGNPGLQPCPCCGSTYPSACRTPILLKPVLTSGGPRSWSIPRTGSALPPASTITPAAARPGCP